jgi:uncharacterized protein (UPF0264 family)
MMELLVSVASAREAADAVLGGAHIIDAKDPTRGALGAVAPDVLEAIISAVDGRTRVSAALGDAAEETLVERDAARCAKAGVAFVKVGLAGISTVARAAAMLRAAAAGGCGVVAVAYADADRATAPPPNAVLEAARRAGVTGVLLDTADKTGPGLSELWSLPSTTAWVRSGHALGLRVAVAGKLTAADLPAVRSSGADIAGVRGAACDGGRATAIQSAKVRMLVELLGRDGDPVHVSWQRPVEIPIHEIAG